MVIGLGQGSLCASVDQASRNWPPKGSRPATDLLPSSIRLRAIMTRSESVSIGYGSEGSKEGYENWNLALELPAANGPTANDGHHRERF